jgi:hypothetical protein
MASESYEEPHPSQGSVDENEQKVIEEAARMLRDLDSTPLNQMTPMFYQHGCEELRMMVRDLLRMQGRGPRGVEGTSKEAKDPECR